MGGFDCFKVRNSLLERKGCVRGPAPAAGCSCDGWLASRTDGGVGGRGDKEREW